MRPRGDSFARGRRTSILRLAASVRLEAHYTQPYLAHAPLEPPNATARCDGRAHRGVVRESASNATEGRHRPRARLRARERHRACDADRRIVRPQAGDRLRTGSGETGQGAGTSSATAMDARRRHASCAVSIRQRPSTGRFARSSGTHRNVHSSVRGGIGPGAARAEGSQCRPRRLDDRSAARLLLI